MSATTEWAWFDDRLVPVGDVGLSPYDHGVLVGDGVFETTKVVGGTAFALRRHLDRLARSAAGLGLPRPDLAVVRAAVEAVVAANGPGVGRVRITLTSGPGPLGSARGTTTPSLVVLSGPAASWGASAAVVVVPWPRNERSPVVGLKTISYAENVVALAHAHELGADEAVFANLAGNLCEGTATNVFVGMEGRLVTPPLAAGCLPGVTRDLVLETVGAEEVDVAASALAAADEAFLTSSTRDVQAIATVDGNPLRVCPGPLTAAAAGALADLAATDLDP